MRADDQCRIPVVAKRVLAGCRLGLDVHQLTALAVVACEAAVLVLRIDDVRVTRFDDGLEAVTENRDVEVGVADAVHTGRARRSAERGIVLRAAVDIVEREIVVGRRLVELRDREVGLELPVRATIPGFVEAPVTAVEHMVRVRGIDPHRVTVHVLVSLGDLAPALAAVLGDVQPGVHGVDAIDIVRIGNQFVVVLRAGADVVATFIPACAGVGGTVDASLVALSLDDRVQDVGIRRREGQADAAHLHAGQPAGQLGPGSPRVDGLVDPRAGPAVNQRPDATATLVARGVEHVGVARVEQHLVDPGVFVDLEHALPALTAVEGFVQSAVPTGQPERPLRRHVDDVRVSWIDDDLADMLGLLEADVVPALSTVGRFVDAVAVGHRALTVVLARADPDDVRVLRVQGHATDGVGALVVEDRRPGRAGVVGLPHSARGDGNELPLRLPGVDRDVADSSGDETRSETPQRQAGEGLGLERSLVLLGFFLLRMDGGRQEEAGQRQAERQAFHEALLVRGSRILARRQGDNGNQGVALLYWAPCPSPES